MRKATILACFLLFPTLAGCSLSEALFTVFGGNYSGGGYTREEKKYDFDRRVEESQNYDAWNR